MSRTKTFRSLALTAVPIAALLLAGCGSAPAEQGADGGNSGATDDFHGWMVKYAECMQGEGLDYPTPDPDPNVATEAINVDELGGMAIFKAADSACEKKVGPPPAPTDEDGNPIDEEAIRTQTLELTQCLREQGVDVEDPKDGFGLTLPQDISAAAMTACGMSSAPGEGE